LRVNGKHYNKYNVDSMLSQFVVPFGSKVSVDVLRNDKVINTNILVEEFKENPWENETFNDSILYIRPYSFSLSFITLLPIRFVKYAQKNSKMIMILDLRSNRQTSNRQTSNSAALLFLDLLFPDGEKYLSINHYWSGKIENRKGIGIGSRLPEVYVLINESTANGASLIAQVIKLNKRGVLIGASAVGSEAIHNIFPLNDEYMISLGIADIYNSDGRKITGTPIEPDILIKNKQYTQFTDIDSIHMDFGLNEVLKIIHKQ
jgi:C-terminal processing protease CtpA/Prc